jgi:hypothetical protein
MVGTSSVAAATPSVVIQNANDVKLQQELWYSRTSPLQSATTAHLSSLGLDLASTQTIRSPIGQILEQFDQSYGADRSGLDEALQQFLPGDQGQVAPQDLIDSHKDITTAAQDDILLIPPIAVAGIVPKSCTVRMRAGLNPNRNNRPFLLAIQQSGGSLYNFTDGKVNGTVWHDAAQNSAFYQMSIQQHCTTVATGLSSDITPQYAPPVWLGIIIYAAIVVASKVVLYAIVGSNPELWLVAYGVPCIAGGLAGMVVGLIRNVDWWVALDTAVGCLVGIFSQHGADWVRWLLGWVWSGGAWIAQRLLNLVGRPLLNRAGSFIQWAMDSILNTLANRLWGTTFVNAIPRNRFEPAYAASGRYRIG